MIDFGERIKFLRMRNNLTQAQLAERIGVTKSMVSAYETAMRLPSLDTLVKLSRVFKVSTDYLLGVDKRHDLNIPTLTEKQKQAVYALVRVFNE